MRAIYLHGLSPSRGPHVLTQITLGLAEIISIQEEREEPLGFLWIKISAHVNATSATYGCTSSTTLRITAILVL